MTNPPSVPSLDVEACVRLHDGEPTVIACPQGCGGTVKTTDKHCASCRRALNEIEIAPAGACWAWFGAPDYRMRCQKAAGHSGAHCEHHDRCGAQVGPDYCGFPPGHDGPHAWEIDVSVPLDVERARAVLERVAFLIERVGFDLDIAEMVGQEPEEENPPEDINLIEAEQQSQADSLRALASALPGMGKDSERLDALESWTKGDQTICPPGNHGGENTHWLLARDDDAKGDRYGIWSETTEGPTLREAIDAARAAQPQETSGAPNERVVPVPGETGMSDEKFLAELAAKFERETQVYLGYVNVDRAEKVRAIAGRLAALTAENERQAKAISFAVGWLGAMLERRQYDDDHEVCQLRDTLAAALPSSRETTDGK